MLGAGLVLVGIHWLFSALAFHFERFDTMLKGRYRILVLNGEINQKAMQKSYISLKDLEELLRLKAQITDISQVQLARLESSGEISVMPQEKSPHVVEVDVKAGVPTVRIQW